MESENDFLNGASRTKSDAYVLVEHVVLLSLWKRLSQSFKLGSDGSFVTSVGAVGKYRLQIQF